MSFLTSNLATGAGSFLQQAAQAGTSFLNSTVSGEVGTFLQEAAQAGSAFAELHARSGCGQLPAAGEH